VAGEREGTREALSSGNEWSDVVFAEILLGADETAVGEGAGGAAGGGGNCREGLVAIRGGEGAERTVSRGSLLIESTSWALNGLCDGDLLRKNDTSLAPCLSDKGGCRKIP